MKPLSPALNEYRQFMQEEDFIAFLDDLINIFVDATQTQFDQLKAAFHENDNPGFKRAAHSMKSSGRTFNIAKFTSMAAELEARGCLEDPEEIGELIVSSELEFEKAKISLEELRIELKKAP